jgi:hypothetical protein
MVLFMHMYCRCMYLGGGYGSGIVAERGSTSIYRHCTSLTLTSCSLNSREALSAVHPMVSVSERAAHVMAYPSRERRDTAMHAEEAQTQ